MGNQSVTLGGVDGGLKQEGFLFKLFGLEKLYVLHLNPLPLPSLEFWPPVDDEADFCFEAFFVAISQLHAEACQCLTRPFVC